MTAAHLTIDLGAVVDNWRALDAKSETSVETGAVVKADAYGLGAERVGQALYNAGARTFFVALAEEGEILRRAIGSAPRIFVFSGLMAGDAGRMTRAQLIPLLNAPEQWQRLQAEAAYLPYGIQLDSGMNRLGFEPADFALLRDQITAPELVMSHLACADEPDHAQNAQQFAAFRDVTDGITAPRSLSATGGTLLGADFHFDLVRPGIGLYGGQPFADARPVAQIDLPVIQVRDLGTGESVGYGASWVAKRPSRIATIAAGYADGLHRAIGNGSVQLYAGDKVCPLVGRVSMDLITVDVTDLEDAPDSLTILNAEQKVDDLADAAGTIGYEILTSLGARYSRTYHGE